MVLLSELENSLFGLSLEAGEAKKVEFKSERMVNITMASLDIKKKSDEFVQVVVKTSETNKYIMCTLSKEKVLQQTLQLMINAGENVTFYLNCEHGHVNLTGYYINEEPMMMCQDDHRQDKITQANQELKNYMFGEEDSDYDENDDEDLEDDEEDDEGNSEDDEDDDDEETDDEDDVVDEVENQTNGKRKATGSKNENNKKIKDDEKPPTLVPNKNGNTQAEKKKEESTKALTGGVIIKDLLEGKGPVAKKGKFIHVYYSGKLKNGKQFDSCVSGKPFKFRLGSGEVIKGWDVGFENMKVGGKRQIVVPPNMGYGNKRMGPDLPANSTLIFDVELKAVS